MKKDKNYIIEFFKNLYLMDYESMYATDIKETEDYISVSLCTEEFDYSAKDNTLKISNCHASETLKINDDYIVDIAYCWYWDVTHVLTFWKKDRLQKKKIGD